MKKTLLITLLLIVGCSKEPINYKTSLVERDGVFYTNDTNKPYSGQVFSLYEDGKKKDEGSLKDGKMISKTKWEYYSNGQMKTEITYKDGKEDGLEVDWYANGQKMSEVTFKDGEKDGLATWWYENGQKVFEAIFKNGEQDGLWTQWYENGQKAREGTYKDGKEDGLWAYWSPDSKESSELIVKDGLPWDGEWRIFTYSNGERNISHAVQKESPIIYLESNLMAPCCWIGSVYDHGNLEMEKDIATMVRAGKTVKEILDYYRNKYGERIFVAPDLTPKSWRDLLQ
jgi:antitoxin component YwqK of YwqJK toxin-antitoxin module